MEKRESRLAGLLAKANKGDKASYKAFLEGVTPAIRSVARAKTREQDDVEDVVQDTLIAIHQKRHTWREGEPCMPWVHAIARYKAADLARRKGRRRECAQAEDIAESVPDNVTEDMTAGRDVEKLLERVDERSATIVRSISLNGETANDVGRRLGMTENAVRVAHHRAMARLQSSVQDD